MGLPKDQRQRLLALIHLAKKQLKLSEDQYRNLLYDWTGKDSAADLSATQLNQVLAGFKKMGFVVEVKRPGGRKGTRRKSNLSPAQSKLWAIWYDLEAQGKINQASSSALSKFCEGMTGVSHWQMLDDYQINKCIEGLKAMQKREAKA
jgi:phage gp16-like protein